MPIPGQWPPHPCPSTSGPCPCLRLGSGRGGAAILSELAVCEDADEESVELVADVAVGLPRAFAPVAADALAPITN